MVKKIILGTLIVCYCLSSSVVSQAADMRNYYGIDESFQTVEHGKVTLDQAYKIIDEFIENQIGLQGDAGYVISKSMLGFYITDNTFIEIYIDDENTYRMKFEAPERKRIFTGVIQNNIYQKEIDVADKTQLKEIVKEFFSKDAGSFKKYFDNL